MSDPHTRSRRGSKPGLRALAGCGDGFWELDLLDGSAWYSDWFYRRLGWPLETKRNTLYDLRDALDDEQWESFMRSLRAHLEQSAPLEVRLTIRGADGQRECWLLKGTAERTHTGLPMHVAGSARQIPADEGPSASCTCGMFDALPSAAAILDREGNTLYANAAWWRLTQDATDTVARAIREAHAETLEFALGGTTPRPSRALKGRLTRVGQAGGRWLAILESG